MTGSLNQSRQASTLLAPVVAVFVACTPRAAPNCYTPRPSNVDSCTVVDAGVITFQADIPSEGIDAYCESECLDVNGVVVIDGYERLSEVPLLAKMRHVFGFRINPDTLTDLQGLESVETVSVVSILGHDRRGGVKPAATLSSLKGLRAMVIGWLSLRDTFGVLSGAEVQSLEAIELDNVDGTEVDLSTLNPTRFSVGGAHQLETVRLGAGPMTEVRIDGNSALTTLEWDPALRLSGPIRILNNNQLSSCRVREFVASTSERRDAGSDDLTGNGPCP